MPKLWTEAETRKLVCEGRCNPGLRDYDSVRGSFVDAPDRTTREVVTEIGRTLAHTLHVLTAGTNWSPRHGWVRRWKCTVCNHHRFY